MEITLGMVVFATTLVVGIMLAMIQRSSNTFDRINFPFNFTLPLIIVALGGGYFVFSMSGVQGIMSKLASVTFFSAVTLILVDWVLKGKEPS